jgi:hypothetical protein
VVAPEGQEPPPEEELAAEPAGDAEASAPAAEAAPVEEALEAPPEPRPDAA